MALANERASLVCNQQQTDLATPDHSVGRNCGYRVLILLLSITQITPKSPGLIRARPFRRSSSQSPAR